MASPTKAFIDPTAGAFLRLADTPAIDVSVVNDAIVRAGQMRSFIAIQPVTRLGELMLIQRSPSPQVPPQMQPKLPTPPMGKMAVLTFPPVYKERMNYTGQLFPVGSN